MSEPGQSRAVVEDLFAAMADGDGARIDALLAEDIVWDFPGDFGFSGTHVGKAAVFTDLVGAIDALYSPEGRHIDIQVVIADGAGVAAEYIGHNVGRNGEKYENRYAWFMHVVDGRVSRIRTYTDTQHIHDVLAGG